jgi:RNA polymerase sigma-70 factor (ECF subfamily)
VVVRDLRQPGPLRTPPTPWTATLDELRNDAEMLDRVRGAIDRLPQAQREVLTLRDVAGLSAEEACQVLSITDANQRVLLHRARARVRRILAGGAS